MKKIILGLTLVSICLGILAVSSLAMTTVESQVIKENIPNRYSIEVSIPVVKGMKNANIQKKINNDIKKTIMAEIARFKKDEKEKTISVDSCLAIDQAVVGISTKYVSLYCFVMYFVAGAHPSHWVIPFNYDLTSGKTIQLKDIFKSKNDYLTKLSILSKQKLRDYMKSGDMNKEYTEDSWINEGTKPKDANFQNYTFNQDGINIIFEEYQVCAYVSGMPEISLTWEELGVKFPY